jgi:hypothetical protein
MACCRQQVAHRYAGSHAYSAASKLTGSGDLQVHLTQRMQRCAERMPSLPGRLGSLIGSQFGCPRTKAVR